MNTPPIRILTVITNGLNREGITTTQLEFFRLMDKSNMVIDVASVGEHQNDISKEFQSYGCNVIEFPDRKKETTKYIRKLWMVLKSNNYDIIHVHGSSCLMAIELSLAKMAGVKVRIAHSRNTCCDHNAFNYLLRPLFDRSYNVAYSCGNDAGKWLFKNSAFTVIHNGKDLEKFKYSESKRKKIRDKYSLQGRLAFGFVGNLKEQKNPVFLMEIFKAIFDINKDSRFFVIGDGEMRAQLEEKAKELGIHNVVTFMGRISYVNDMLQGMDLMLLPSKWEGLPNVVIEWQAAGLPCIVSDQVTQECKLTDLVQFMSINESPDKWAAAAVKFTVHDRAKDACQAQLKLKQEGFDLNENVISLRKKYFDLVSNYK